MKKKAKNTENTNVGTGSFFEALALLGEENSVDTDNQVRYAQSCKKGLSPQ